MRIARLLPALLPVLAFVAAPLPDAGAAELVGNGSFETPTVTSTYATRGAGTKIGAWTAGPGGVDHLGPTWQAADGRQSIDLNSGGRGSVFQDLATVPGARYTLRFAIAGNADRTCTQPIATRMSVRWGGAEVAQPTFSTLGHTQLSMGWTTKAVAVTAASPTTRIEFASLAPTGFCGPALDAVSVSDPVLGKAVNVEPLSGKVLVRPKGSKKFVRLGEARQIPTGSLVDVQHGRVRLTSAVDSSGHTQSGDFSAGVFQPLQSRRKAARGLTDLRLKGSGFGACSSSAAHASRRSARAIRRLRAKVKGRFRTSGRYSSATVRGTDWTTVDRCDGTLTSVRSGRVVVRDFVRKRDVLVRAGRSYLARAPG